MPKVKFGLVESHFTPVLTHASGAHPTYGTTIDMGNAVKAYITANKSETKLYGDDVLQLEVSEFTSASLEAETLLDDLEIQSKLFGATYTGGVLTDKLGDSPAAGAYDYIQKLRTRTGIVYRAVFLYYCVPALPDDNADTKGESVTFVNANIKYTVYADNAGAWRAREDFDTLASAEAWLQTMRGAGTSYAVEIIHSGTGTSVPGPGTVYVASAGSQEITFTTDPDVLLDNGTDVTSSISNHKYTISNIAANHSVVCAW